MSSISKYLKPTFPSDRFSSITKLLVYGFIHESSSELQIPSIPISLINTILQFVWISFYSHFRNVPIDINDYWPTLSKIEASSAKRELNKYEKIIIVMNIPHMKIFALEIVFRPDVWCTFYYGSGEGKQTLKICKEVEIHEFTNKMTKIHEVSWEHSEDLAFGYWKNQKDDTCSLVLHCTGKKLIDLSLDDPSKISIDIETLREIFGFHCWYVQKDIIANWCMWVDFKK